MPQGTLRGAAPHLGEHMLTCLEVVDGFLYKHQALIATQVGSGYGQEHKLGGRQQVQHKV